MENLSININMYIQLPKPRREKALHLYLVLGKYHRAQHDRFPLLIFSSSEISLLSYLSG